MTTVCLLGTKLEVLSPLQCQLLLSLTFLALQPNHNLTCSLGLFVKYGLCLSSKSHLLRIVTTLSLCEVRCFTGFVLCYLVRLMLAAFLASTEGVAFFWYVDHF